MKIKVAVVMGGSSVEHEVSVITALQAAQSLNREKYQPVALYITKEGLFYTGAHLLDIESFRDIPGALAKAQRVNLVKEGGKAWLVPYPQKLFSKPVTDVDVALLGVHGTNVEDGALQGALEYWGVPYTGCDVAASAAGMDKWLMKAAFNQAGVPCLPARLVSGRDFYADTEKILDDIEGFCGYPCVIKPFNLGSSVGISKAKDRASLEEALALALSFARAAICEKAVTPLREINCAVLGDHDGARPSCTEEPLNATDILTYADKYQSGGGSKGGKTGTKAGAGGSKASGMASLSRVIPAPIPPETEERVKELAVKAFHAIGAAGVARVDFLMNADTGELFVNEINTIPGSLSFYLWEPAGLSYTQLLDELISLALKRRRDREKVTFSFDTNLLASAKLSGAGSKNGGKV